MREENELRKGLTPGKAARIFVESPRKIVTAPIKLVTEFKCLPESSP